MLDRRSSFVMSATKKKRNKDKTRNKQKTLIKKAYELRMFLRIDVTVIISKQERFYTYMLTDQES
jgi:hypothetical protein